MDTLVRTPGLENLSFITSGTIPPNPAELLGSAPMLSFIQEVTEEFDLVLFDTPPVLPVTDAAILASHVDSVLLVYQLGRAGRGLLKRAKNHLDAVHAELRGIILNDIKAEVTELSSTESYYQHYQETKSKATAESRSVFKKAMTGVRNRLTGRETHQSGSPTAASSAISEYEEVLQITDKKE